MRRRSIENLTDAEMELTFNTNVYAYMRLARAALHHMQRGAVIIATSSETGILGAARLPDHSATRGAINAFTKTLAQELLPRGIRVNAVAPGSAQPQELAPAYVLLASNADSCCITGNLLQVMGGETTGG
jgi:NAD(P)-dependent dehydrogenase (short-subunit alcohol dehydrogenase family)